MIRFIPVTPGISDELIERWLKMKIDRYVHLPVQSETTRRCTVMNRGYAGDLVIANKLRRRGPKRLSSATDISGLLALLEKRKI